MPPPLALTLGEPAGIGPDITLAAWRRRAELVLAPFDLVRVVHRHRRQHRHAAALLLCHEHVRQPMLHYLIRADRLTELNPGRAVFQGHFVHRLHRTDSFGGSGGDPGLDNFLDDGETFADLAKYLPVGI